MNEDENKKEEHTEHTPSKLLSPKASVLIQPRLRALLFKLKGFSSFES
jgi:hypothetical protein